jgi:multiple sugar transport system substrate-binding protein
MAFQITRRGVLKAGLASAVGTALGTMTSWPALAATRIRASGFVESTVQLNHTVDALKLYAKDHPDVTIVPEYTDYGSYVNKLATEAAGGNAPDLMTTNGDLMAQYSTRGVIQPLDEFTAAGGGIDISDYAKGTIVGNTIDGKLFGIPNDVISPSLIYDKTTIDDLGLAMPAQNWTWEDLADFATSIAKAKGPRFYGVEDAGASYIAADIFFRGRGKEFWTADRKLGFDADDLADWFAYWQKLRKSGGTPPGDIQALASGDDLTQTGIIAGRAAMLIQLTDTYIGLSGLTPKPLGLHFLPEGFAGGELKPRQYTYAGNSFSVSSKTPSAKTVIDIISFLHADPEGQVAFYKGSGMLPASASVRKKLAESGSDMDKRLADYIADVQKDEAPPRHPAGVANTSATLRRANEAVAFGKLDEKAAAKQFMDEITATAR